MLLKDLTALAAKFDAERRKSPGKHTIYPQRLGRKAVEALAEGVPALEVAKSLRVSLASIKSWSKAIAPRNIAERDDLIPVVAADKKDDSFDNSRVSMRITTVDLSIPLGQAKQILDDLNWHPGGSK